jgi:hypothetical protein
MKSIFVLLLCVCSFSSAFSQITGAIVNPQLSPQVFYRNFDNIFMVGGIDLYNLKLITIPECKIEKVFWLDNNTKSPCFKISDIPETKQITITIMGKEKGESRSFGTYRFAVRNTAPK